MQLVACVPPARAERLRAALGADDHLHLALDWAHAERLLRREAVDVCVVDPSLAAEDPAPIVALWEAFRSTPFVLYTALQSGTAAPIAALGRAGIETLVLEGVDDAPALLHATLAGQPGVALAAQLQERLRPALRQVPPAVAHAIVRVIRTPAAFHGVPDLAAAAGVSRRTIYRECARARLASPRELIAAARALRAYALLRESDHAIEDVAETLRFSSAHHLTKTMRWACGLTTARARERIAPAELVALVAERLMPAGPDAQVRTSTS